MFELMGLPLKLTIVYFNWFFLIPRFFDSKKILRYALALICTLVLMTLLFRLYSIHVLFPVVFPEWIEDGTTFFKGYVLMQILLVMTLPVVFTTFWQLYMDWRERQEQTKLLEIEKTETELKYLKSQINPHFLFNTLNNIYSLSLEKSEKVPDLILKLSNFLSFSLYETGSKTIPLQMEIELIVNFIELQTARFFDRVNVRVDIQRDISMTQIPPMILIPFVENAFKHGLKNETGKAEIDIKLFESNGVFSFVVKNSIPSYIDNTSTQKGGIGLKNIRRRLELLYDKDHFLEIEEEENTFKTVLKIKINNEH